jgi:hypothetical protein
MAIYFGFHKNIGGNMNTTQTVSMGKNEDRSYSNSGNSKLLRPATSSSTESIYNKVLNYEMPKSVGYVAVNRFGVKQEEVAELWTELKKYFVVSLKHGDMPMMSENVDKVWHSFILNLNEYVKFSNEIGKMIMHVPNTYEGL